VAGDKLCDGVEVSYTCDMRDAGQDLIKLQFYKGKLGNKLNFIKPAMEALYITKEDKDAYERKVTHDSLKHANSIAVTSYKRLSEEDKQLRFALKFPETMQLTDRAFLESGDDTESIDVKGEPILAKYDTGLKDDKGQPIFGISCRMSWFLLDESTKRPLHEAEAGSKMKSKMQKMASGL
jgi:hypothetical protein